MSKCHISSNYSNSSALILILVSYLRHLSSLLIELLLLLVNDILADLCDSLKCCWLPCSEFGEYFAIQQYVWLLHCVSKAVHTETVLSDSGFDSLCPQLEDEKINYRNQIKLCSSSHLLHILLPKLSVDCWILHGSGDSSLCKCIAIPSAAVEMLKRWGKKIEFNCENSLKFQLTADNLKTRRFRQNMSGPRDLTKLTTEVKTILNCEDLRYF